MECESLAVHDDGVSRVRAAVVADDGIVSGREKVHDLALALVSPLEADDSGGWGGGERWRPGLMQRKGHVSLAVWGLASAGER
ncbi:MAG: hypothetical protein AMXMBFR77_09220 [Phycisphaerales bacterium]|nr:MAG: hypothetical protein BroJett004_02980 [Planctomycetota bacterium]